MYTVYISKHLYAIYVLGYILAVYIWLSYGLVIVDERLSNVFVYSLFSLVERQIDTHSLVPTVALVRPPCGDGMRTEILSVTHVVFTTNYTR